MTALLSNSADIALMGTEAGIYVYNEGKEDYPLSFIQLTQTAGNFVVSRENETAFQWSDLADKVIIGGRNGGMPQMVMEYVLKSYDLIPGEDLEILTNYQFETTASAFVSGVGDYTVEFEPTASTIESQGNGYIVASLGTETGKIPYTVYMATQEYLDENAEVVQKFTNAIYKGQIWVDEHTAEEIAEVVLPQFPESDAETLAVIINRYKSQDTWQTTPEFSEDGFERIQDILDDSGTLTGRVPFEDLIDNSFAEKAIESIK